MTIFGKIIRGAATAVKAVIGTGVAVATGGAVNLLAKPQTTVAATADNTLLSSGASGSQSLFASGAAKEAQAQSEKNSNMIKVLIGAVVAVVVGGLLYVFGKKRKR